MKINKELMQLRRVPEELRQQVEDIQEANKAFWFVWIFMALVILCIVLFSVTFWRMC